MPLALTRRSIPIVMTACLAFAQSPTPVSQEATIQALLKEVHALRVALEQSNQIGPRIQIALARMQLQDERVRSATRQLQDAHDKHGETQTKRAQNVELAKQFEGELTSATDTNARKQMEYDLTGLKQALSV